MIAGRIRIFDLKIPVIKIKQVAMQSDRVEESLNLRLIHEGLCVREQWLTMQKLSASVSQDDVLALLDKVPDSEVLFDDKMPDLFS